MDVFQVKQMIRSFLNVVCISMYIYFLFCIQKKSGNIVLSQSYTAFTKQKAYVLTEKSE